MVPSLKNEMGLSRRTAEQEIAGEFIVFSPDLLLSKIQKPAKAGFCIFVPTGIRFCSLNVVTARKNPPHWPFARRRSLFPPLGGRPISVRIPTEQRSKKILLGKPSRIFLIVPFSKIFPACRQAGNCVPCTRYRYRACIEMIVRMAA